MSPKTTKNHIAALTLVCLFWCLIGLLTSTPAIAQSKQPTGIVGVNLHLVCQEELIEDPEQIEGRKKESERISKVAKQVDEHNLIGSHDVIIVGKGDDLKVTFRLENNGKQAIYYLVENYNSEPAGFVLFQKEGEREWSATSPIRGRATSLTGGGYRWVELLAGASVKFHFTDLSSREGRHAISVFVNTTPDHENRIEIISEPYIPFRLGTR